VPKAYVLASGGIDSSTCLALAKAEYNNSIVGLSLNYGQRHAKEIRHAELVCMELGLRFISKNISGLLGIGGLTDESLEIPKVSYEDLPHGVSPTYVPFRNGLLLSIAASIASADPEAVAIYYGAHAEDAENDAYPDCSVPFIGAMTEAIFIGTYKRIQLQAPLQDMIKSDIIIVGNHYNVPWHLTWSCYEGRELHCGVCPTCRSRREGFKATIIKDPTRYAA